jgi:hypothetical protein
VQGIIPCRAPPFMSEPNKVERVSRQVIQKQLLDSLEQDKSVVAVLLTEEDLSIVIRGLDLMDSEMLSNEKSNDLLDGLKQLRKEAFGK